MVAPNEPFRLWVMNAGPTLTNAFHVIGTMFNETHDTGNPANTLYGLQTFNIAPGERRDVRAADPGSGPLSLRDARVRLHGPRRVGLIKVDPAAPAAPTRYPPMADPFSGGIAPVAGATTRRAPPSRRRCRDAGHVDDAQRVVRRARPVAACTPDGTSPRRRARTGVQHATAWPHRRTSPFTIAFDNQDLGVPHNVAIYTDDSATKSLFIGEMVTGPKKVTYEVGPLARGTYFFRCDVHPTTMTGTFVVA